MLKGTIYHLIARTIFLVSSYALHITMAYHFLDPRHYGTFGVLMSILTIAYTFLSTGLPQAASKFISQDEAHADAIMKKAMRLQYIYIAFVVMVYVGGVPVWILFLNDRALTRYLLMSAVLIPLMGTFQMYLSYLNGKRLFSLQAWMTAIYSVCRFALAYVLVLLGMKIPGILMGFFISALVALIITRHFVKRQDVDVEFDARLLIRFAIPIVLFSLGSSFLLNLDILLLKHFFPMSPIIGYYTGAMTFGKAPFFIFYAFSVTILPMVSKALSDQDIEKAKTLVRRNLSFLLFLGIPSATILFATSEKLLAFVYPSAYTEAASSLGILVFSMSALAILYSLFSMITANGKPAIPTVMIFLCIPLQISLSLFLIPEYQMKGAAYSSLITVSSGVLVAGFFVFRYFGTLFDTGQVLRTVICSGILYFLLSKYSSFPTGMLPLVYGLAFLVFCFLMFMIGGIRKSDIAAMRRSVLHWYTDDHKTR